MEVAEWVQALRGLGVQDIQYIVPQREFAAFDRGLGATIDGCRLVLIAYQQPAGENPSITRRAIAQDAPAMDTPWGLRRPATGDRPACVGARDGVMHGFSPGRQAALPASKSFASIALIEGPAGLSTAGASPF